MVDHTDYRLILMLPDSSQLLATQEQGITRLPRLRIPKWNRPAEEITTAIQQRWHVASIAIDFLQNHESLPPCVVVESSAEGTALKLDIRPSNIDEISHDELTESERATLQHILAGTTNDRGPFSRIGWLSDVQRWIKESAPTCTSEFTREIRQLNAGGNFVLVRLGTQNGPAFWLKATGKPNEKEFTITAALSQYFPEYLPPLLCTRPDWNAWVTQEVGQSLDGIYTQSALERAVISLAELQTRSVSRIEELFLAGCYDLRIHALSKHMQDMVDYLNEVMELQTTTKVPRLDKQRLHEIGQILDNACARIQDLQVPDALIHNDLNLGNILFDGSRCVFTDWAEACIGNPFLAFQHLSVQLSRHQGAETYLPHLKVLYGERWLGIISASQIARAFALTPLLAIASCLYGRGSWLNSSERHEPRFQSYCRSLARHMDRAAREPELLEAL